MRRLRDFWADLALRNRRATDAAIAGLTFVAMELSLLTATHAHGSWALRTLLALTLALPLMWRRTHPLAVLVAQFVPVLLSPLVLDAESQLAVPPVLVQMVALYSAARHLGSREAAVGLGLALAATLVLNVAGSSLQFADFLFPALFLAAAWLAGRAMSDRADLARLLVEKTALLEAERDARSRAAVLEERARIARELHDLVAHSVSVMVVQAAAGKRVVERYPVTGAEAAAEIQRAGRGALIEMRRLFGMLHGEDGLRELAATPRVAHLDRLVASAREAGVTVTVELEGDGPPLPAGTDVVAYRVIQEALENTIQHAGPTRANVRVTYGDREVAIEVVDDGPAHGTAGGRSRAFAAAEVGNGLLGMRERVELYGGHLHAGPREGGGFAVRVSLPRQPVAV